MAHVEQRLKDLGIVLPDFGSIGYYGTSYGKMKAYHQVGSLLFLSTCPSKTALYCTQEDSEILSLLNKVMQPQGWSGSTVSRGLSRLSGISTES